MTRRHLLAASLAAPALSPALFGAPRLPIKKAVLLSMLPPDLSFQDRFQLAADCGFAQVEAYTVSDPQVAEEIKKASDLAKVPIHSVMNSDHWKFPLSSPDPEVVAKCRAGMETSIRNAKLWGAETVLLVPAVVDAKTSYADAWKRSQAEIRKMIPLAQESKVIIAVEEVWNKFLTSPLEFARYVDEFKSPWVRAYFDVGNVVLFGFPQDWIRTLGPRIVKVHIKDFRFKPTPTSGGKSVADFCALREGQIDWPEVYKAFAEIGYRGTATVELGRGDKAYLTEVSRRFDEILTSAPLA
ncbi:MAG: sugar phosphate isomerase/epimerase [Bryobacteraceae bacterium]|nr:sugar phosphate isomerase/epimerase [Bryobacteraceae bacterium]